ncbi:hypothetical protein LCGC14_1570750 [marine sediment metagenome]|uniref:Uncharacterized protein n=1 Tax=marine sediment metagenome TaxID=412755 RepID=A0A0F9IJP4_9ZZZZ
MLARLYDAVWHSRERKKAKLLNLLRTAMPYYDVDYDCDVDDDKDYSMTGLIEQILEICDVKKS